MSEARLQQELEFLNKKVNELTKKNIELEEDIDTVTAERNRLQLKLTPPAKGAYPE